MELNWLATKYQFNLWLAMPFYRYFIVSLSLFTRRLYGGSKTEPVFVHHPFVPSSLEEGKRKAQGW